MSTGLDFQSLPRYQKRTFVTDDVDLTNVEQATWFYKLLLDRDIHSQMDLERWVLDRSELEAAISQAGSILYISMTCQTDNFKCAEDYKRFIETVAPAVKPLEDELNQRYLEELKRFPLEENRYGVYIRRIKMNLEIFVPANVDLQTKVDLLSQEYQTVCAVMTVKFEGQEKTLPQMAKYLFEPNRGIRESAWQVIAKRRLQDKDKLNELFDQMFKLRNQIAQNVGCKNFCEYKFKSAHRFDYTPKDCYQYHSAVEKLVIPLWSDILKARAKQLKLKQLRPWDLAVDPQGLAALKPFEKVEKLISGCQEIFNRMDGQLGRQFSDMVQKGLLDLDSRKGKAPGGYQNTLDESRKPFIFMNAVGVDDDVRTLLHEAGHAFHALACAQDPLLDYRHGPMEFNEVASMAMELLADENLDVFYDQDQHNRSTVSHLEDIVFTLGWVATVDAFQHWLYEHPGHTVSQRNEQWIKIRHRFAGDLVNWDGLEEEHAYLWHRQLHIFEYPFYYIEYGIAQLGALQLWLNSKKNFRKALANYYHGLSFGGARPLPELYKASGIQFDFSERTIAPLIEILREELMKKNSFFNSSLNKVVYN